MDFSANLTPVVKVVLPVLFAIYVVDLVTGGALSPILAWQPVGAGFRPWQVLSCWLQGVGAPWPELMSLLGLFFLIPPAERLHPGRKLLDKLLLCWALACAFVFLGVLTPVFRDVGVGSALPAILTALVALIGYGMPGSTFLFMFVLPVKAIWLARFDGLLAALLVLANRDSGSLAMLGAWCGAWLICNFDGGLFRRLRMRIKREGVARRGGRFQVIDGGKNRSDWVN